MAFIILNEQTHLSNIPPQDKSKTWISDTLAEEELFPSPEKDPLFRKNVPDTIPVKEEMLKSNVDIRGSRYRKFTQPEKELIVKWYNSARNKWSIQGDKVGIMSVTDDDKGSVIVVTSDDSFVEQVVDDQVYFDYADDYFAVENLGNGHIKITKLTKEETTNG